MGCSIRGTSKTVTRGIANDGLTVFTVQALRSLAAVKRSEGKSIREGINYGTEVVGSVWMILGIPLRWLDQVGVRETTQNTPHDRPGEIG